MLKPDTCCYKYMIDVAHGSKSYVNPNIVGFTSVWFQILLTYMFKAQEIT